MYISHCVTYPLGSWKTRCSALVVATCRISLPPGWTDDTSIPWWIFFQSPNKSNVCVQLDDLTCLENFLTISKFEVWENDDAPSPLTLTLQHQHHRQHRAWQIRMRSPQGASEKWKKTWSKDVYADVGYWRLNYMSTSDSTEIWVRSSKWSDPG